MCVSVMKMPLSLALIFVVIVSADPAGAADSEAPAGTSPEPSHWPEFDLFDASTPTAVRGALDQLQAEPEWSEDFSRQEITGKLLCAKNQTLVESARVSAWLKSWNLLVPTFYPCYREPNRPEPEYTTVNLRHVYTLQCYVDQRELGYSWSVLQLYVEHQCSVDGSKIARYIDVNFSWEGQQFAPTTELYPPENSRNEPTNVSHPTED